MITSHLRGHKIGFINKVQRLNWTHEPLAVYSGNHWEVTGNIYENSELVEVFK